jgi:preprotein translocase subunit Sss1
MQSRRARLRFDSVLLRCATLFYTTSCNLYELVDGSKIRGLRSRHIPQNISENLEDIRRTSTVCVQPTITPYAPVSLLSGNGWSAIGKASIQAQFPTVLPPAAWNA